MTQEIKKGYARLSQIIGDKKSTPPVEPLVPVSKSTWYDGIRKGRYPKPVKLGPRISGWKWQDLSDLCESIDQGGVQ